MKNDQEFVDNLVRVVKRNYTNPDFDISSMAGELKISDRQLQRKVKALTGRICSIGHTGAAVTEKA